MLLCQSSRQIFLKMRLRRADYPPRAGDARPPAPSALGGLDGLMLRSARPKVRSCFLPRRCICRACKKAVQCSHHALFWLHCAGLDESFQTRCCRSHSTTILLRKRHLGVKIFSRGSAPHPATRISSISVISLDCTHFTPQEVVGYPVSSSV